MNLDAETLAHLAPEILELREGMARNAEHYRTRAIERRERQGRFSVGSPSEWEKELADLMDSGVEDITVGYLRVSSENQAGEMGLPVQRQQIMAWCQLMAPPRFNVDMWVWDVESGTIADRLGYLFLQEASRHWQVTRIVCQKLDRFSRQGGGAELVIGELKRRGTTVFSATEAIADNYMGDLVRVIFLAIARYEAAVIYQRMRAGQIAKVRRDGTRWGSPPPYGYFNGRKDSSGNGKLTVNEAEAQIVRLIFELHDKGYCGNAIYSALNRWGVPPRFGTCWSPGTVSDILFRDLQYRGKAHFGTYPDSHSPFSHPAILPPSTQKSDPRPTHPRGTQIPDDLGATAAPPIRISYWTGLSLHQARTLATTWMLYDQSGGSTEQALRGLLDLNLRSVHDHPLTKRLVRRMVLLRPSRKALVESLGALPYGAPVADDIHATYRVERARKRATELRQILSDREGTRQPSPIAYGTIAMALNREGFPTPLDTQWNSEGVRRLLGKSQR